MYRSEIIFRFIGNLLKVMIQVSIWTSLLGVGGIVENIDLKDMITFTIISSIVRMLIQSNIAYIIATKVRTGEIAMDLIKPINFKGYFFSEQLSENSFGFLTIGLPVLLFSILSYGFKMTSSVLYFILFLTSLILGITIMFYIDYILGLCIFWVKNEVYIGFIGRALFDIFSGALIPLWFYPNFLVRMAAYLPFRLVAFEPIAIYLGKLDLEASFKVLLLQVFWIGILYLIERGVWKAAQNKVFIQGG